MRPYRCSLQVSRSVTIVVGMTVLLAVATHAVAQETVHQVLAGLGPGQAKGSTTAPVIIEEFSDFQCSYCGKFARETLPRLSETYIATGQVRFVYRHFAILGPQSTAAAAAAACAGAQGQFWPYHDRLFADQGRVGFTRQFLLQLAQELSLHLAEFTACLDTERFTPQVRAETNAAMALGLRGTPGFIVNGRQLVGALPFATFQSVIEEALATVAGPQKRPPDSPAPAPASAR